MWLAQEVLILAHSRAPATFRCGPLGRRPDCSVEPVHDRGVQPALSEDHTDTEVHGDDRDVGELRLHPFTRHVHARRELDETGTEIGGTRQDRPRERVAKSSGCGPIASAGFPSSITNSSPPRVVVLGRTIAALARPRLSGSTVGPERSRAGQRRQRFAEGVARVSGASTMRRVDRIVPHLAAGALGFAAQATGDGVREAGLDRCVRRLARPHAFEPVANVPVLGMVRHRKVPVGRLVGTLVRGGAANPVARVERALLSVENLVVGFGPDPRRDENVSSQPFGNSKMYSAVSLVWRPSFQVEDIAERNRRGRERIVHEPERDIDHVAAEEADQSRRVPGDQCQQR